MIKKCIILANGNPPLKRDLEYFRNRGYNSVICADGGANHCKKLGIIPEYIIGDMDSATASTLRFYEGKVRIICVKRQNDTDVEKCIKFAVKKGFSHAILMGVTGNRLDHSFCNLGIAMKFSGRLRINIVSDSSYLSVETGDVSFHTIPGETISLYGIDSSTTVTTKGLKYSLRKENLPFGVRESTSNIAVKPEVQISIRHGKIFIIRDLSLIMLHDLIK